MSRSGLTIASTLLVVMPALGAVADAPSVGATPAGDSGHAEQAEFSSGEAAAPEEPTTPRLVRAGQHLLSQLEAVRAEVRDLDQELERAEGGDELGESSVDFVVRPWAKTQDYWDVYWDVTREVKRRFDAEGITIPFPQRQLHIQPNSSPGSDT